MTELDIELTFDPRADDIERLAKGLHEHADPYTDDPGFDPVAVFAHNGEGHLVGGVYGYLNWRWLHVSLFWVSEDYRGQGLGSRLLERIEADAAQRGCRHAHLDTLGFQARPFYEAHGYEIFATLDDYPGRHQRIFMKKSLAEPT